MSIVTHSKNAVSAVNQQERLDPWWIVGFTDGEGCFSVSTFRNRTCSSGFQTLFEFVITQGISSESSLQKVREYFGVGHIYLNKRYDNHRENILRYCVRRQDDLKKVIIPFFKKYPLQTAKRHDFEKFRLKLKIRESSETIRKALGNKKKI
jgi:hypothetical protein